jgi:hypothetical protein
MNDSEIDYLKKAINNDNNKSLIGLTFDKVERKKREILEELELPKPALNELLKRLEDYRYVDEINELQSGNFMRWINITNPEDLRINSGAILCEIKIEENITLVFKNYRHKYFQINMEENLLFQKFSDQERIILYALDHLDN